MQFLPSTATNTLKYCQGHKKCYGQVKLQQRLWIYNNWKTARKKAMVPTATSMSDRRNSVLASHQGRFVGLGICQWHKLRWSRAGASWRGVTWAGTTSGLSPARFFLVSCTSRFDLTIISYGKLFYSFYFSLLSIVCTARMALSVIILWSFCL